MNWSGVLAAVLLLGIFGILGTTLSTIIRARQRLTINFLMGYMIYYGIFEIVYLLCLAFDNSLNTLKVVWQIAVITLLVVSLCIMTIMRGKGYVILAYNTLVGLKRNWKAIIPVAMMTICTLVVYVCGVSYISDGGYAYSAVGDSVYSGRLFMRDVYTGMKLDAPDMSYAFSGYYMHSAVLCSIFKVSPVIMQHNVMGIISILVSIDVVYLIGRIIFRASIRYTWALILFYEIVNVYLLFYSGAHYFLFTGAYDSMAQLPYILIPAVALGFIYIIRYNKTTIGWVLVALSNMAGAALSVAALAVVPLITLCGIVTVSVCKHEYRTMLRGLVCLIPGIIYNMIYRICI